MDDVKLLGTNTDPDAPTDLSLIPDVAMAATTAFNDRRPDPTTITPASIRDLLVDMVQNTLGYPAGRVLVENMADRRPTDGAPYATVWIKRTKFLVQNDGDFEDDAILGYQQILHNECLITAQFSVYGANAYAETIRLSNAVHASARWTDLWRCLGFAGQSDVQDISMLYGAQIQQRALFEVDFYAYMGSKFTMDWFRTAQLDVVIDNKEFQELYPKPEDWHDAYAAWEGDKTAYLRYPYTDRAYYEYRPFTTAPPWPLAESLIYSPNFPDILLINDQLGNVYNKTDADGQGSVKIQFAGAVPPDTLIFMVLETFGYKDQFTIQAY